MRAVRRVVNPLDSLVDRRLRIFSVFVPWSCNARDLSREMRLGQLLGSSMHREPRSLIISV